MKVTKSAAGSKKTKVSLAGKGKFKTKGVDTNGKLKQGIKHALDLHKKGSLDNDAIAVVKSNVKETVASVSAKSKRKRPSKPGVLSPEVQLGLELDAILENKNKDETEASNGMKRRNKKVQKGPNASQDNVSAASKRTIAKNGSLPKKQNRGGKKAAVGNDNTASESSDGLTPTMKSNSHDSSESTSSKKSKSRKRRRKNISSELSEDTATNIQNSTEDKITVKSDTVNFTLKPVDVLNAVKAALKLHQDKAETSKKLLDSEQEPIFLNFIFYLIFPHQKIIRFNLAHNLVSSTSDICLIVPDIAKNNTDESKSKWEEILKNENVTNISEVLPLKSLLRDYSQFQDKRKLSERFEHFLVDGRISHRVYGILGRKFFHYRRKTPTPVKLPIGDLKKHIDKALLKVMSLQKATADTFTIQVGHTGMKDSEIQDNIMKVWEQFPQQFGVYWENIRRASLLLPGSPELPIFCSLALPEGKMRTYKNMTWKKTSSAPVKGELSTTLDQDVLVFPSGKVVLKNQTKSKQGGKHSGVGKVLRNDKKKEKKNAKSKVSAKAASSADDEEEVDSDLGGRADMLTDSDLEMFEFGEVDSEEEIPEKIARPKSKREKGKNTREESDSNDEFELDRAEEMYLEDLAKEKKSKNRSGSVVDGPSDPTSEESSDSEQVVSPKADSRTNKSTKRPSKKLAQVEKIKSDKNGAVSVKKGRAKNSRNKTGAMKNSPGPSDKKENKKSENKSPYQGIKAADKTKKKQKKPSQAMKKKAVANKFK